MAKGIKSVAEKASIFMELGQMLVEAVDASGILVKPKRKPRVKRKAKKAAEPKKAKKVIKKAKPAPRPRDEEDEEYESDDE